MAYLSKKLIVPSIRRGGWFVTLISFLMITGCSIKPMYQPGVIRASSTTEINKIQSAIKVSLVDLGWKIMDEKEGMIRALLDLREHTVTIDLLYTKEGVQIQYVDSSELGYREKDGQPYIHKKYTSWIKNLEKKISINLVK